MRTKFTFLVSMLVLSLVLSACAGTVTGGSAVTARSLIITGMGTVHITPDVAYIYIGVHTEGADISQAVSDNNANAQAVSEALKESGVVEQDIQTSNFSIWPSQQYDMNGQMTGTVYMVDNTVYVTVRNLDTMGGLLEAAIEAGANSINSIQFDVEDKSSALVEARQLAVDNANALAEELAAAADVTLGDILSITYYDSQPYPYYGVGGGGGEGVSAAPIAPGQLTMSVSVNITFEIK